MISIIIRALNEEKYLHECLQSVFEQKTDEELEVVLVDSGSSDNTVNIAKDFNLKIVHISQSEFTFGRSLNLGCEASSGHIIVFLSAHCVPISNDWLSNLTRPLKENISEMSYGRQIPREGVSNFAEGRVFSKYYPQKSMTPQVGFFCNNANSAIKKETWLKYQFDETLTGLEDMEIGKRLTEDGGSISYVSDSCVEHIHEETWDRIKLRYEREAVALERIAPELSISFLDTLRLIITSVAMDIFFCKKINFRLYLSIVLYRFNQYTGSYIGGVATRKKVRKIKMSYFYPNTPVAETKQETRNEIRSPSADESTQ